MIDIASMIQTLKLKYTSELYTECMTKWCNIPSSCFKDITLRDFIITNYNVNFMPTDTIISFCLQHTQQNHGRFIIFDQVFYFIIIYNLSLPMVIKQITSLTF